MTRRGPDLSRRAVLGGLGSLPALTLGACDDGEPTELDRLDVPPDVPPPPPLFECTPATHRYKGRKRHVLFLSIDDLNDWVGVLGGHPQTRTPNLDRFAKQSTLFTNAHCAAPACGPSRVSTLLGLRPTTTGIYENWQPWKQALPDAVTLPRHFRNNGYRVVGGGKIFHIPYPDIGAWDDYYPSLCGQRYADPVPSVLPGSGVTLPGYMDWGPLDIPDDAMPDAYIARWAEDQLMSAGADPLFLGVGIFRPHLAWYLPREYFEMFDLASTQLPEILATDREDVPPIAGALTGYPDDQRVLRRNKLEREAVRAYLAAVAFSDAMVGRVLDALERSPIADDTIVVLWSDHGWHLGEKLHWRKFSLWEEATRVPLMIRAPDLQTGLACSRPVSLLDIYPTLMDLCGLPPPYDLDGKSLVPFLEDPAVDTGCGVVTTWLWGNDSIRTDRWRYTRYADWTTELYDHDADPHEWDNLSGRPEHARVEEELEALLPADPAAPQPYIHTYSDDDFDCGLPT